ncbi:hypothetical protein J7438_25545 [Thalassotalea sp. G20_0]|uniref:hypothetical protein n=1 Tax=Thalassotalea sp. G20_0 TaxID=2821093 RepID=UPI001ADAFEBC|nr:hypothetical protein [Thalassotalea sp. G20_0]MBO9497422.1 hypothetical protein [Thalassotalea sp. G20_0]
MPDGVSDTSVVLIDELSSGENGAVVLDDNLWVPAIPVGLSDASVVLIDELISVEIRAIVLDDNA